MPFTKQTFRRVTLQTLLELFLFQVVCYSQITFLDEEKYYNKAIGYALQGSFKEAEEEFKKALSVGTFYTPARSSLQIIRDALAEKIKSEGAVQIFKGEEYLKERMWDEAILQYDKAIASGADYALVYLSRGVAHVNKFRIDQAISDYTKAIEIDQTCFQAYFRRGVMHESQKHFYDLAISDYTKAIEIEPSYRDAYFYRGRLYEMKGLYNQALSDYIKVCEIDHTYYGAHGGKARMYEKLNIIEEAIKSYQDFIHWASESDASLGRLGIPLNPGNMFAIEKAKRRIKDLKRNRAE